MRLTSQPRFPLFFPSFKQTINTITPSKPNKKKENLSYFRRSLTSRISFFQDFFFQNRERPKKLFDGRSVVVLFPMSSKAKKRKRKKTK